LSVVFLSVGSAKIGGVISHSSVVGILPVKCIGGQIFTEFKYDRECLSCNVSRNGFNYQCQVKHSKTKGIMEFAQNEYIRVTSLK